MKRVISTILNSSLGNHQRAQKNALAYVFFVSTVSIHIGMLLLCSALIAVFPLLRKTWNILPAGSRADYLTALGFAWQPREGMMREERRREEGGEEGN